MRFIMMKTERIVKYEQLPENLKNAFIAVEDKTFWEHKGFNFRRIFGAVYDSLKGRQNRRHQHDYSAAGP